MASIGFNLIVVRCLLCAITFVIHSNTYFPIVTASVRFTNVICETLDPSFVTVPRCELTVPARGQIAMNLYLKMHKVPVRDISVNFALYKKSTSYRPFMYNATIDFCQFMLNRKRFPVFKVFFEIFACASNVNHSCPYNHDVFLKDLIVKEADFKLFPIPSGDYLFALTLGSQNVWRLNLKAYPRFEWSFL